MSEITWRRGNQVVIVTAEWAYGIWWRRPGEKHLRWTRKSKFHLWRHAAVKEAS